MAIRATIILGSILGLPMAASAAPAAHAHAPALKQQSDTARHTLETEMARIARGAGGEVGVLARDLRSGRTVAMNEREAFPMASTFKIAVAGAILSQVDAHRLDLQQMVNVDPKLMLSSEGIAEIFPFPGVAASVHNLIESMLTRSDNTATNVLAQLAGGPAAVTAWVESLGIKGMRIDGDTNGIIGRFFELPPSGDSVEVQLNRLQAVNPALEELGTKPNAKFDDDPRDTASPESMIELLTKIKGGHLLTANSTDVLLGAMQRCITGKKRLRGLLPPGTQVADKTGTIGGTVNDVGFITLPEGRGEFAIAVYIKKSPKSFEDRESVIAQIARLVYDYMSIESSDP
jgi:beta-lactamase class A